MKSKPLNGINLGGWLVIEKWMTPSLFKDSDARNEFELCKTQSGRQRIKEHHARFITEDDLAWLKEQGIEILRVPIGYWIFGDDKRYEPAIDRLDWLVATSLSYGFKLLLDLHGAPGAQNRAAHSGSGNTLSDKHSTKWLNNSLEQDKTIEVLCRLAERYYDSPNVWGIELLNEPAVDISGLKLARFYRKAYKKLTRAARSGTRIVFSDGYAPIRMTNCFWLLKKHDYPVLMDCHVYQVFGTGSKKRSFNRVIKRTKLTGLLLNFLRLQQPIIVGEWSAMLPFRTTGSQTSDYITAQKQAFDASQAHFYWNYKTEDEGRWNYRDQMNKGLIQ